jgi:hypothetical protein
MEVSIVNQLWAGQPRKCDLFPGSGGKLLSSPKQAVWIWN